MLVYLKDIIGKIEFGTRVEIIEVDKRYLRDKSIDESRYITEDFTSVDCNKLLKYELYQVTMFSSKDDYLTIYIYKGDED